MIIRTKIIFLMYFLFQGIPFAWVIMEQRKYSDYKAILEYIFNKLAPSLRPRIVMTDFECALQKAFLTVLPFADVKGCYFHYSQVIIIC